MTQKLNQTRRLAGLALLAAIFLFSCKKSADISSEPNLESAAAKAPARKMVMSYNKYAGDSIEYDTKGRVKETWVGNPYGTIHEYPSANQVIVKNIDRINNKVTAQFIVTLNNNGKAIETHGTHYDTNGGIVKDFISAFEYDGAGRLTKVTNDNGNNIDVAFTYSGKLLTKINRGVQEMVLEYDQSRKLPVGITNYYGLMYDNYFYLSGLFANGMMGKMPSYAVNKISADYWIKPVLFTNTYGPDNELLKSELTEWKSEYMMYELTMRYQRITVTP